MTYPFLGLKEVLERGDDVKKVSSYNSRISPYKRKGESVEALSAEAESSKLKAESIKVIGTGINK
jgi:hypothetical protein